MLRLAFMRLLYCKLPISTAINRYESDLKSSEVNKCSLNFSFCDNGTAHVYLCIYIHTAASVVFAPCTPTQKMTRTKRIPSWKWNETWNTFRILLSGTECEKCRYSVHTQTQQKQSIWLMTFQTIGNILSYSSVCVFFFLYVSLFVSRFRLHTFFRPVFFLLFSLHPSQSNSQWVYALAHFLPFSELLDFSHHSHTLFTISDGFLPNPKKKIVNRKRVWRTRTRLWICCVVFLSLRRSSSSDFFCISYYFAFSTRLNCVVELLLI